MNIYHFFFSKSSSGFVLLFSIVVSSIIFFIGVGVYSIATKELAMSALTENSQRSIFVADAGIECGRNIYFPLFNDDSDQLTCFNQSITITQLTSDRKSFWLYFDTEETGYRYDACAQVTIEKDGDKFTIFSQGFNACTRGAPNPQLITDFRGLTERVYRISL